MLCENQGLDEEDESILDKARAGFIRNQSEFLHLEMRLALWGSERPPDKSES